MLLYKLIQNFDILLSTACDCNQLSIHCYFLEKLYRHTGHGSHCLELNLFRTFIFFSPQPVTVTSCPTVVILTMSCTAVRAMAATVWTVVRTRPAPTARDARITSTGAVIQGTSAYPVDVTKSVSAVLELGNSHVSRIFLAKVTISSLVCIINPQMWANIYIPSFTINGVILLYYQFLKA